VTNIPMAYLRPKSANSTAKTKEKEKAARKKAPSLAIWRHELELLESDLQTLSSQMETLHIERQRKTQSWESNLRFVYAHFSYVFVMCLCLVGCAYHVVLGIVIVFVSKRKTTVHVSVFKYVEIMVANTCTSVRIPKPFFPDTFHQAHAHKHAHTHKHTHTHTRTHTHA